MVHGKKVRVIEFVDAWTSGGVEKYILQLVSNINREEFEPIVWTTQKKTSLYDDELKENHIRLITMKGVTAINPILRIVQSLTRFKQELQRINAEVFHLHASNGVVLIYAYIAKKCGISKVVVHSHSSDFGDGQRLIKEVGHRLGKLLFSSYADISIACSDKAAEWLFSKKQIKGGKVKIVNYFVDTDRFRFDESVRQEYRNKYGLNDEIVFINIGRFHYQKNQLFLLDLFKLIIGYVDAKLFLIGEGDLEDALRDKTIELGIESEVVFVGTTQYVEKYMWMSDIYILPSLYEGNPITVTEAQAAGLPCLISDRITEKSKLLKTTCFINIDNLNDCTREVIRYLDENDRPSVAERSKAALLIKKLGYEPSTLINIIEELYI